MLKVSLHEQTEYGILCRMTLDVKVIFACVIFKCKSIFFFLIQVLLYFTLSPPTTCVCLLCGGRNFTLFLLPHFGSVQGQSGWLLRVAAGPSVVYLVLDKEPPARPYAAL